MPFLMEWLSSTLLQQHHHRESFAAESMVNDTTVSTIALAVALVALITTISQVLGQFLATADGYRRCQASVMGGWAKMTHRHFRWSEMRFETLYTTPRFGLSDSSFFGVKEPRYPLNGSALMMVKTHCEPYRNTSASETSLVSWVTFMQALHLNSSATLRCGAHFNQGILLPDITIERRSWDFVPPEVVRPLAVVSISNIAILARRLGMIWRQFEPLDGNLRAEGNGHTITSVAVRSMGTVLTIGIQDPTNGDEVAGRDDLYIPLEAADKMGFGIVPGAPELGTPDHKLGTEEEILATLRNVVDPSHEAADRVKGILGANPGWTPGISDIIGLACPMLRPCGSSLVRVPQPAGYAVGLTQQQEGFVVFRNRLKDLIAEREAKNEPVSSQSRFIYNQYEELQSHYGDQWEDQHVCNKMLSNQSTTDFLDDLNTKHAATTGYFHGLRRQFHGRGEKAQEFNYTDLMYSHIRHAVNYFPEALERLNASPPRGRNHYGMRVAGWITEGAHIYFDNIPKIINDMRDNGFDQPQIVEDAWLTMMFRAFLWHRSHVMVEGPRVPSAHWGSKLPVYIG